MSLVGPSVSIRFQPIDPNHPKATVMTPRSPILGASAIAMAIGFNLPYANGVAIYNYPDILRRPAAEALSRFADGGADSQLPASASMTRSPSWKRRSTPLAV
jgi:hypothetical protein